MRLLVGLLRTGNVPAAVSRQDLGDPGAPEVSEFAVDELAAALRLSRPGQSGV